MDLGLGISVGKSQGRDNGSCGGVFLVRAGMLWSIGSEHGWGRESLPATLP
jgi:hypothetical protein